MTKWCLWVSFNYMTAITNFVVKWSIVTAGLTVILYIGLVARILIEVVDEALQINILKLVANRLLKKGKPELMTNFYWNGWLALVSEEMM